MLTSAAGDSLSPDWSKLVGSASRPSSDSSILSGWCGANTEGSMEQEEVEESEDRVDAVVDTVL